MKKKNKLSEADTLAILHLIRVSGLHRPVVFHPGIDPFKTIEVRFDGTILHPVRPEKKIENTVLQPAETLPKVSLKDAPKFIQGLYRKGFCVFDDLNKIKVLMERQKTFEDRKEKFLAGLKRLSRKYKIQIKDRGCGCCDSTEICDRDDDSYSDSLDCDEL